MAWNTETTHVANVTTITVNGSRQSLDSSVGESFGSTVVEAAVAANMGKFRVFLNGAEIDQADAPTTITAGMAIELKPYDVAGM